MAETIGVAAGIERGLAREIIRGERAPGTQLPPVRELARRHRVTVPTIQRVIDRLEAGGLVSARRGSGVTVNDPGRSGDLALLPLWFEALSDQPERAAGILEDFLELRRVVAVHLVKTAAPRIAAAAPRLAGLLAALDAADTPGAIAEADLAFTAAVVEASQQFAVAAIFHTAERLVREVPELPEALYGDRSHHRRVMRRVLAAVGGFAPERATEEVEQALAAWDRKTVARFRALLERVPSRG